MKMSTWFILLAMSLGGASCDDATSNDVGKAPLTVSLWGEDFIEKGIPPEEFVDGYGIVYQKFLVSLSAVTVAKSEGEGKALGISGQRIWDLTGAGPFILGTTSVEVGAYENTGYAIRKAGVASIAGNATAADVQFMQQNGYSVYVEGQATRGSDIWTFAWGFDTETVYGPCHSVGEVSEGTGGTIEITIHGDHLFYDSAVSSEPSLRFEDFTRADTNSDKMVTPEELRAYPLSLLAYYMVPNDSGIEDMWGYVSHMTMTLGHIDGEGHCETK